MPKCQLRLSGTVFATRASGANQQKNSLAPRNLGTLSFQLDHLKLEASQGAERSPGAQLGFVFFPRKRSDPPPPGDRGGGPSFRSNGSAERCSQSERPGRTNRKLVLRPRESYYLAQHRSRPTGQIKGTIAAHQSDDDPPPLGSIELST